MINITPADRTTVSGRNIFYFRYIEFHVNIRWKGWYCFMDRSGGKAVTVSDRKRRGAPAGAGLWITSLTGAAVSASGGFCRIFVGGSGLDCIPSFCGSALHRRIGGWDRMFAPCAQDGPCRIRNSRSRTERTYAYRFGLSVRTLQVFAPFKIAASRRCICRIHARSIPRKTSHQTPGEIACRPEKARITTTQKVFSEIIL